MARWNRGPPGRLEADEIGLDKLHPGPNGGIGSGRGFLGPGQHRRIDIDRRHVVAGLGKRHGDAAGTAGDLQDRPSGSPGKRQVQVQVARVLRQVDVVQPGQRGGGLGIARRLGHQGQA